MKVHQSGRVKVSHVAQVEAPILSQGVRLQVEKIKMSLPNLLLRLLEEERCVTLVGGIFSQPGIFSPRDSTHPLDRNCLKPLHVMHIKHVHRNLAVHHKVGVVKT